MKFADIVKAVKGGKPKTLAVAVAQDLEVLEAVSAAQKEGLATPILVGDEAKIRSIAKEAKLDIEGLRIVNEPDNIAAVKRAVTMVGSGEADVLMKGLVGTADLLRGVLNKDWGLATGNTISYVGIIDSPEYDRLLFLTDPAIATYPDLKMKIDLINNAVQVARALGVDKPKVACVTAVEVVNPKMEATMDAALLAKMSDRGQIKNCVVDGPLALDNAGIIANGVRPHIPDCPYSRPTPRPMTTAGRILAASNTIPRARGVPACRTLICVPHIKQMSATKAMAPVLNSGVVNPPISRMEGKKEFTKTPRTMGKIISPPGTLHIVW